MDSAGGMEFYCGRCGSGRCGGGETVAQRDAADAVGADRAEAGPLAEDVYGTEILGVDDRACGLASA